MNGSCPKAVESAALADYERQIKPYRDAFGARASIATLTSGVAIPDDLLHLFMVHYSAFGISMTRPVEEWIRRAGVKCQKIGLSSLGKALVKHARHEAGHHRLMIADLWTLADAWNDSHKAKIDPITLSRCNLPSSVIRYQKLHERVIGGEAPYTQIALEYEIEALSVRYGPALLATAGGKEGSSFLKEHIAIDGGHTKFNRTQISRLLVANPEFLEPLVAIGAEALELYGAFIDDCVSATMAFGDGATPANLKFKLMQPPGDRAPYPPEWLMSVRSLRSQILFDGGTRPAFGPNGSDYGDTDSRDRYCHHLILQENNVPIGTARLGLIKSKQVPSLTDGSFGHRNVSKILNAAGINRADCGEASRLVLHPDYRRGVNSRLLFAGLWALAAQLNLKALIAAVGTKNGQDRLFSMMGAEMIDAAGRINAPTYNDTLRLALFKIDTDHPPNHPELDHMREFVRRSFGQASIRTAA